MGQADAAVKFLAHGPGYGLYLTRSEALMMLSQGSVVRGEGSGTGQATALPARREEPASRTPAAVVGMQILGGNPTGPVVGEDQLPGKVNYFLGNDPSQWHTNITTYSKVEYQQVYPGIDLDYYGHQGQLEYDFVVAPGADPGVIHIGFTGANGIAVNAQGDLIVHVAGLDMIQHKPVVYQEGNGARQEIASNFVLLDARPSDPATHHPSPAAPQVGFQLAPYDASRPLVIDPVLSYSTYLGGSGNDEGYGIAVDPGTGDALLTGATSSLDFPIANPLQATNHGRYQDAFVARLSADGGALVYSTYLGSSGNDFGTGIAVDPITGEALVTGYTDSRDFPTANPLQATCGGGASDAFVARLSADGSALVYSTYLGGSGSDVGRAIAVDPSTGDALVTGFTNSADFPTANSLQTNYGGGGDDAFVARIS
jgi:hypothetical protein